MVILACGFQCVARFYPFWLEFGCYDIFRNMGAEDWRDKVAGIHKANTDKVVGLIMREADLTRLDTVLDPQTAEVYRSVLPRHARLCELDQSRGLNEAERAELAVSYASLYPTFGDEGIVQVAAAWLATKPTRQARST